MHTYEVYWTHGCGCDREWELLGVVAAANLDDALVLARAQWSDYDPRELVAMEVMPLLTSL